jgi:hypothetical protein
VVLNFNAIVCLNTPASPSFITKFLCCILSVSQIFIVLMNYPVIVNATTRGEFKSSALCNIVESGLVGASVCRKSVLV